jgi:hypothetical protein
VVSVAFSVGGGALRDPKIGTGGCLVGVKCKLIEAIETAPRHV